MSPMPLIRPPYRVRWLTCVLLLGPVAPAGAEPKPLPKEDQARVDQAVERAVDFLKEAQTETGSWKWKMYRDGRFAAAQCALPAYALLEAGVSADDPVIRKAAEFVRGKIDASDYTYEIGLALLFLDRLGDPNDRKLIHTLAARLIAGQHQTGGWSYRCPLLGAREERELLDAVEWLARRMKEGKGTRSQCLLGAEIPPSLQRLPVFQFSAVLPWREPPSTSALITDSAARVNLAGLSDNSNTQFALLGLWVAGRHGVPVAPPFEILVERFERSHRHPGGIWAYGFGEEGGSRSMICVGLLGLAIGRGLQMPTPGAALLAEKDVHVLRGLAALRRQIGKPSGRMDGSVPVLDVYFLWSLERVAMLYDLPTIGDREWYRWGAESLVANQAKGGFWTGASPTPEWAGKRNFDYRATLTTAFALLFLKHSHPMKELTPKLPTTGEALNRGLATLRADDKYPMRAPTTSGPSAGPSRNSGR
jgi:hypothetical protein